jgi:sodium pump decarboxylase gamma subunit
MEGLTNGQIAGVVMATGLVIVFVVLVALILIIKAFGAVVDAVEHKNSRKAAQTPTEVSLAPMPMTAAVPVEPAAEDGVAPETVAAIAAAVYTLYGTQASVVSVRRSVRRSGSRSAWGQAGVLSSTRPF